MNMAIRSPIWWPFLRFIFIVIMLALACIAVVTAAEAKQASEDRGNGNSAAENVDGLNAVTTGADNTAHVTSDNKLGTLLSTRRVKNDIKPMDKASEAILALKPVTFRYKKEVEPNGAIQFGLIAEEVAEIDPELVIFDKGGKPESVRYEAINAMLLNEFLKEHKKVEEQLTMIRQLKSEAAKREATINELKKDTGVFNAQLKEQTLQIQKVSAQVQMREPLARVALSNP